MAYICPHEKDNRIYKLPKWYGELLFILPIEYLVALWYHYTRQEENKSPIEAGRLPLHLVN